jgi:hypothetical protein
MAGSNTYGNYRHQADAFHAYQIAKRNGIPESNIILLAFDDIAKNKENPFPGKVFNKPTAAGTPGVDVYDGVKISYSGKDVTAANFLKVLSGDTSAPGPVLKSTASDNVFVYYADHGGTGILGVPTGNSGGYIHAADINKALETLQAKGGYKDLLFYLEACESGSIFKDLLKAPNAKAVTAANPKESSWGWYCAGSSTGGDMVDGKNIGSCLGDEFSVRWMEDTDAANIGSETVGQQDKKMITAVTKSHVQIYGTTSFDQEAIGDFVGNDGLMLSSCSGSADPVAATCYEGAAGALGVKETVKVNLKKYVSGAGSMDLAGSGIKGFTCADHAFAKSSQDITVDLSDCLPSGITVPAVKYCSDSDTIAVTVKDKAVPLPITATLKKVTCGASEEETFIGVDSRQVEVHQAYYKVNRAKTAEKRKKAESELAEILAQRRAADVLFGAIAKEAMGGDAEKAEEMLEGSVQTFNAACHQQVLASVVENCGSFTDYSLRYSRLFANLCNYDRVGYKWVADTVAAVQKVCVSKVVV